MDLEFVLLAKSKKYNNYCVAGFDLNNYKWVRLVSEDPSINYAVPPGDLLYDHNYEAAVLDKVMLKCKKPAPLLFQPENVIIDDNYKLSRKGQIDYSQVEKLVEQKEYIFHNTDKRIPADELNQIPKEEQYSLILIKPINPVIHVRTWEDNNKKVNCSFNYNHKQYQYFAITDHAILQHYQKKNDGNYSLSGNVLFVISLGELYERDSCHYKLISSVIS